MNRITTHVMKGRAKALAKRQIGFGLVITTQMCAIIFWRWTWTPWDWRAR